MAARDSTTSATRLADRPEIIVLSDEQKKRVRGRVRRRRVRCGACGNRKLEVGNALFVGFLFLSEKPDAHMVALTCTNPRCSAPRTGITMPAGEFLPAAHG